MSTNLASQLRLMLVTDDHVVQQAGVDIVELARRAVRGGVTAVQLRLKQASAQDLLVLALALREAVGVPVLVNDRVDVAAAAGSGVHLGPEDLSPELARRVLPAGTIIGASVGTAGEVSRGERADYWGVGPFRLSGTKPDAGVALGVDGVRAIVSLAGGRPCLAIGGVRPEDVPALFSAGVAGVAVVSGILSAADPEAAARSYASRVPRLTR